MGTKISLADLSDASEAGIEKVTKFMQENIDVVVTAIVNKATMKTYLTKILRDGYKVLGIYPELPAPNLVGGGMEFNYYVIAYKL